MIDLLLLRLTAIFPHRAGEPPFLPAKFLLPDLQLVQIIALAIQARVPESASVVIRPGVRNVCLA
jgi:hypothetical protein